MVTVRVCSTCYDENLKITIKSLSNFDELLKEITKKCVLPLWE